MNMLTAGERLVTKAKPPKGKPSPAKPKERSKSERERLTDKGFALATEIREGRGEIKLEERSITDDKGNVLGQTKGDRRAYLTKHLRRGEINLRQCKAGERFAADFEHSQAGVNSALDPSRLSSSGSSASRSIPILSGDPWSALMVRQATIAVGSILAEIVVWVAVGGRSAGDWAVTRGKAARDGLACLRLALDALAAHYEAGRGEKRGY